MEAGAITEYIDVAQIVLYLFWAAFAALIFYLRREDKREGYPLQSDGPELVAGFPPVPEPKVFSLAHGGTYEAPNAARDERPLAAEPAAPWPGAPLEPTGDPMLDGVGPASYAQRPDEPDLTIQGEPRIVPLRAATEFWLEPRDPDPLGMQVVAADGRVAGSVYDVWVDRSEPQVRYLEVEVAGSTAPGEAEVSAPASTRALLPMTLARIMGRRRQVLVASITSAQFARVPALRNPERVTLLEEDRICAYFASGHLYAEPSRQESLL
ncbi:MAG: photosynthetic reaction center subunit H [Myxococcota bacterium]|nr:photosynthetic reaction center subunit H [Myxococcota bacterium]